MNRAINIFLSVVFLIGMGSCAVTDIDRAADFRQYKSFGWGEADIKVTNPIYNSDLINKNIKTTVEREFARRGIVHDEKDPDFVINYHTYTEKKQQTSGGYYGYPFFPGYYPFFRYGYGWGLPYGGFGGYMPGTYTYTEGTLVIDIKDKGTNETIWRGIVTGNINSASNLEKQVSKGIRAIMKKYPVTPQEPIPVQKDNKRIS